MKMIWELVDDQAADDDSIRKKSDTHWSSTFAKMQRCLKLLEILDAEDDDIMEVMPTPVATKRLLVLFKELNDIEPVSKSLQGRDVDLLDVRQWWRYCLSQYSLCYMNRIGLRASIIHTPAFESGYVRVLRGRQDSLTQAEKAALLPFASVVETDSTTSSGDENLSFVEHIRKRRRTEEAKVRYEQLKTIPATSNDVECFSVAQVMLGHQRHGLHPSTLETILFLRKNPSYWDASSVDSLN
ncbi:LOW QUALITY PROTEIN: hypothetical protein PHMEG_00011345 [Phytophthora megakarya]|uniref:Uncharacterized protein n=1 Tax=Phytophthora megakarya TaxID=4795 RepID=A0A225WCV0_9STRA|nr:LOW QUALITY PROTEIN: hypothetical protein PHMEG_00011345 [Phytophthora megakarya]